MLHLLQGRNLRPADVGAQHRRVGDMHPNQRGQRPGPIPGTVWIDGTLFCEALPKSMRKLDLPGQFATTEETLEAQAAFDRRRAYAFTPLPSGTRTATSG